MIESIANRISLSIKKHDSTADVEVINYSLIVILNAVLVILFTLIFGLAFDDFNGALIAIASLTILRLFSGGFHFKSVDLCTVVTVILFVVAMSVDLSLTLVMILNIISLILIIIFSPSNVQKNTNLPDVVIPYFKVISILIVSSNFILENEVIAFCFLVQSLSLIRVKKYKTLDDIAM